MSGCDWILIFNLKNFFYLKKGFFTGCGVQVDLDFVTISRRGLMWTPQISAIDAAFTFRTHCLKFDRLGGQERLAVFLLFYRLLFVFAVNSKVKKIKCRLKYNFCLLFIWS